MKILVTGAGGYIGAAVAGALRADGHLVSGLARSENTASRLRQAGFDAVAGDFLDPASLVRAIAAADPDVVVSIASAGGSGGDADTFRADRDAVRALIAALEGRGKSLIFTSGSAVFGVFAGGDIAGPVFDEAAALPLPPAVFAPSSAQVPDLLVKGFGAAMAARVETEQAVLSASGLRGMVIRPANVYGHGGSMDIPGLIAIARARGVAPHLGSGGTSHGYVHLDDVAELYRLAVAGGRAGGVYHGVAEEVSQRDLAAAVSRLVGAGDRTESLTLEQMFALGGAGAVSLMINKRLSAELTREQLGWVPTRTDTLRDVEFGSYAG